MTQDTTKLLIRREFARQLSGVCQKMMSKRGVFIGLITLFFCGICLGTTRASEVREISLEQAVQLAVIHNHDLKTAKNNVRYSTLALEKEKNDYLPQVTATLTMLLSAVAGVSLLVGGIGVMNIMLVSVTERTREIGILIAIGARSSDILSQFLIEAVILSLSGGIIGIFTGIVIAYGFGNAMGSQVILEPSIILISVGFTAVVGVFFGYYPAKKASALNPIDAMRYE